MVSESQSSLKSQEKLLDLICACGNLYGYLLDNKSYKTSLYVKYQSILKKNPQNNVTHKSCITNIITAKIITIGKVLRKALLFNTRNILGSISFIVYKVAIQLYPKGWFVNLSVADFRRKKYVHI